MKSRERKSSSAAPVVQPQPRFQHTIAREAVVEGFGFWSSRDVRVEFRPAQPNAGITFVRSDLNPVVRIPAAVERRIEMPRRTALVNGVGRVEMVEHILAALAGLQIDNCEV
jgi:UDP-3-O-[3-hydroxymyristoyl] N-acetylglucosamine deacetylase